MESLLRKNEVWQDVCGQRKNLDEGLPRLDLHKIACVLPVRSSFFFIAGRGNYR